MAIVEQAEIVIGHLSGSDNPDDQCLLQRVQVSKTLVWNFSTGRFGSE